MVLTIIVAVLMILFGVSCMFTPILTFLSAGYFISFLFLVYGIFGIIRAFQKRATVWDIILSILSIAVGILSIVRPGGREVIDSMLLIFVSIWFIIQGAVTIAVSIKLKDVSLTWVLGVIVGVLSVILGFYSLIHPMVAALAVGFMIGFYFIESGINMITLASLADAIHKGAKEDFSNAE